MFQNKMEINMLQSTSNIAYQPLPLSDNNDLEEVVIESIDKIEMTAVQLFKEQRALLKEKCDTTTPFQFSSLYSFLGSCPGFIMGSFVDPLWYLASIPGVIGGAVSCKHTYDAISSKNEMESYLLKCCYLEGFYNSFENFKMYPEDYKLGSLFEDFSNIGGELSNLIYAEDLRLFHDTGKLFLMDAAATFLQNKSPVAKLWKETLESTLKSNESKENAEPWHSMGVVNPKLESYLDFAQQRKNLNSIMMADRIVHIYKNVMETYLANNKEIPFCSPIHLKSIQ